MSKCGNSLIESSKIKFKTHISIYQAFWKIILEYRGMMLINAIRLILMPIVLLSAWLSIEKLSTNPYSNSDYIFYYLLVPLVLNLTDARTVFKFCVSIRNGALNRDLLKPYPPLALYVLESLTNKTVQLIYLVPITLLCLTIFSSHLPTLEVSISKIFLFILAIFTGALIRFLVSGSIALIGFWVEDITTINLVLNGGVWALFGGMIVPVETFPGIMHKIAVALPYRYMLSFPIEILRGKLSALQIQNGFLVVFVWSFVFIFVMKALWERGLRSYSAYGG